MENKEKIRLSILEFLQWKNQYGEYVDAKRISEGMNIITYEEAVKHFFGLINADFYSKFVNNIIELTYEEVINTAIINKFYDTTVSKIDMLIGEEFPTEMFYEKILN